MYSLGRNSCWFAFLIHKSLSTFKPWHILVLMLYIYLLVSTVCSRHFFGPGLKTDFVNYYTPFFVNKIYWFRYWMILCIYTKESLLFWPRQSNYECFAEPCWVTILTQKPAWGWLLKTRSHWKCTCSLCCACVLSHESIWWMCWEVLGHCQDLRFSQRWLWRVLSSGT
jgi:hypothetical protein